MNWQHFRAFLWLRWRLRVNQFKRAGTANAVLTAILLPFAVLLACLLFVGLFLLGYYTLRGVDPVYIILVWDGVIVAYLLWWGTGLITDLQRSDALSLDKFLHLPVSLKSAFLVNYLSSLASLNLIVFLPAMLGLSLALVCSRGPALLALFPLVAAFFLMMTAATHQFQGWLAVLMSNKRRRRTVIVMVTMAFVLLFQLPNMVNIFHQQTSRPFDASRPEKTEPMSAETLHEIEQITWIANVAVPLGWLALGAGAAAGKNLLVAALCTLGMTALGCLSLWRSYRTTVRLYTGQYTSGKRAKVSNAANAAAGIFPSTEPVGSAAAPEPRSVKPAVPAAVGLLEWRLPLLSEQAAAIAMAGMRGLFRAPEAKMMLLTPVLLVIITGSMLLANRVAMPDAVRPWMALGGMGAILLGMVQLTGNQFGFDRAGYRVYVLCAAPRRDILLGKNLALAPFVWGLGLMLLVVVEVLFPMRFDHLLAIFPQFITVYLMVCLLANLLSIFGPMPIAAGSLKPANARLVPILLQLLFAATMPLAVLLTALPLMVEFIVEEFTAIEGWPIAFFLSLLQCAAVVLLYHFALTWEGTLLQMREQRILEVVTTKTE